MSTPHIDPNKYQVFLMSCYCGLPISFARHNWFVVNNRGNVSRWELLMQKDYAGMSWGYMHKDARKPFEPLGLFSMKGKAVLDSDILGQIEGDEGSLAAKMAEFIEHTNETYPYCREYLLWSPNSNTYIQWVLDQFPAFPGKLPWNSFGKGYKVKV